MTASTSLLQHSWHFSDHAVKYSILD